MDTFFDMPCYNALTTLLLILICAAGFTLPPANADEATQSCDALLQGEPFVDLLTSDDGRGAGEFASDRLGASLLGSACQRDDLDRFFTSAGYQFVGEEFRYSENGGSSERWERDAVYVYCNHRSFLQQIFLPKCEMQVSVSMFEGKITHISAGLNK